MTKMFWAETVSEKTADRDERIMNSVCSITLNECVLQGPGELNLHLAGSLQDVLAGFVMRQG